VYPKLIGFATVEFCKAVFCITQKGFNAVDMRLASGKFVLAMEHPIVFITVENQSVAVNEYF
jgi:hypothetical protein